MHVLPNYYPSLKDYTIGIVGIGEIGTAVARCLKFFNSTVVGYGRNTVAPTAVPLDGYWYGSQLSDFLAQCDYIINLLPSTKDTVNFYGGDTLQAAKKKPVLINVGRGDVIHETDVIRALDKEWISKAVLDVFPIEPLPTTSILWEHPNVIITPHFGGIMMAEHVIESFKANLENYNSNKPLNNEINWEKGY